MTQAEILAVFEVYQQRRWVKDGFFEPHFEALEFIAFSDDDGDGVVSPPTQSMQTQRDQQSYFPLRERFSHRVGSSLVFSQSEWKHAMIMHTRWESSCGIA